jgi:hypothetical protein
MEVDDAGSPTRGPSLAALTDPIQKLGFIGQFACIMSIVSPA